MIDVDIDQQLGAFRLAVRFASDVPIVGLFGRSGSGKTSVVNAIAGISRPERGRIVVNDTTLFDAAAGIDLPLEARRTGYVFQDALLFPHLDVRANLFYGFGFRAHHEQVIEPAKVIALLGLDALLGRRTSALSGGEKQRVAIGRALLAQPRILLLDEPLAALDNARKAEILAYIEALRDELRIPMVYVSHSVAEITRLTDTVVVLAEGRCLAAGRTDDVMGRADLKPATGREEVGTLIETHVEAHDHDEQLTTLAFDGGRLLVPHLDAKPGDRVRVRIRARDVSLALERPRGISILNILPARVTRLGDDAGASVDVHLSAGTAPLIARITRRSLHELGVRPGQDLHVLIKAVSFDERSVGYA